MEKTKIIDRSGDKKYFTQIPNMIVNHSTAYEQSLYLIMKRLAGEEGSCYASLNFLSGKMGIHKTTVSKTITKLLKRKWIEEIENKTVKGGKVRQFVVVDIWPQNIKKYESGAEMTTNQGGASVDESGAVVDGSGAQSDTKKNYKEEHNIMSGKPTDWNLEKEIEKLVIDPKRHIQVIGVWLREMKFKPENSQQVQSLIKRNLRPAKLLEGYKDTDIRETIQILRNTSYLTKFTLETIGKYIDEIVANKKKKGPQILRYEEIWQPDGKMVMRPIYELSK